MNKNKTPKSFFRQLHVWIVMIFTLGLALYVSNQIIDADNLKIAENFGATNAQLFMDSFKLPIGIIAAGLSILLLLATQHRSEQTAEQIRLTNEANANSLTQNTLKNYYESISDFEKYIDTNFHSDLIKIKNKRQLYKLFFPDNSHEHVIPYTTVDIFKSNVSSFIKLSEENIKINTVLEERKNKQEQLQLIINTFISNVATRYGVYTTADAFPDNKNAIEQFKKVTDEVRELLYFCTHYTPSNGIVVISNSYLFSLPIWKSFFDIQPSLLSSLVILNDINNRTIKLLNPEEIKAQDRMNIVKKVVKDSTQALAGLSLGL
ncbi:MAG: hypothetical protein HRT52_22360 [Colwellia sp.]|nr:hypothetical protein [Colwellia sp.]